MIRKLNGGKKATIFVVEQKAYLHLSPTRVLVVSAEQEKARGAGVPGFLSKGAASERPHVSL